MREKITLSVEIDATFIDEEIEFEETLDRSNIENSEIQNIESILRLMGKDAAEEYKDVAYCSDCGENTVYQYEVDICPACAHDDTGYPDVPPNEPMF